MKSQSVKHHEINARERLNCRSGVIFVVGIVRPLHAAVEEVARIGIAPEVGEFRDTSVDREVSRRGGDAAKGAFSRLREVTRG